MRLRQSAKNGDWTARRREVLANSGIVCYSSVPRKTTQTLQSENEEKRGVDEMYETLHNLASVLMNKTLLS